uniref:(California timema) hypothetical protein n=1 Tax=Timema californicum TaxID=61474 RepID=A0A7R9JGJ3_TIMCA|nr:unnamed protein product [Timema californicum]
MHIVFLGTASCFPTPHRCVSCTAIRFEAVKLNTTSALANYATEADGQVWIFDCGEGSQIQYQKSSLRTGRITKIFITHLHGDHMFGLPGFLCTIGNAVQERPEFVLELYGPQGLRKFVRQSLSLSRSLLPYGYVEKPPLIHPTEIRTSISPSSAVELQHDKRVHELVPLSEQYLANWAEWNVDHDSKGPLHPQEKQGRDIVAGDDSSWDLLCDDGLCVKAGLLHHTIPSFGFVVTEANQNGRLDVGKLQELGVPSGALYGKLKKGETVTLECGTIIEPSQVLGPTKLGRKASILGDTRDPWSMAHLVKDSDVLLHEATMQNSLHDKAIEFGHSTPAMAAKFADRVGAKRLVLFHYSQRYKPVSEETVEVSLSQLFARVLSLTKILCILWLLWSLTVIFTTETIG